MKKLLSQSKYFVVLIVCLAAISCVEVHQSVIGECPDNVAATNVVRKIVVPPRKDAPGKDASKQTLPPSALIMIGAVAAALITGFFSYMNLAGSKENNIAELRGAWLELLTENMGAFLAEVEVILRLYEVEKTNPTAGFKQNELKDFRTAHKEEYRRLNEAYHTARLRLNSTLHAALIREMEKLDEKFYGNCSNYNEIVAQKQQVVNEAQKVSADVWNRLSQGDAGFVRAKKIAIYILVSAAIIGISLILWDFVFHGAPKSKNNAPTAVSRPVKQICEGRLTDSLLMTIESITKQIKLAGTWYQAD